MSSSWQGGVGASLYLWCLTLQLWVGGVGGWGGAWGGVRGARGWDVGGGVGWGGGGSRWSQEDGDGAQDWVGIRPCCHE